MKNILITGSAGFIGRNLITALRRIDGLEIITQTSADSTDELKAKVLAADLIYHLAGVNRPTDHSEFERVNTGMTGQIADILRESRHPAALVFASSIQAKRNNPYGNSKRAAEDCLIRLINETGNRVCIYRLPGVFGKWSRPNYNTVVATFCHNIARDLPISISDPDYELYLVYIDEVVRCLLRHLQSDHLWETFGEVQETFHIRLGELANQIRQFREMRSSLLIPDVSQPLTKYLYSTYLSFLPDDEFAYPVELRTDDRGWLFELAKSKSFGQIFVSTTKPGITRGNHFHDTKVEKFCLIQGQGIIRFRNIDSREVLEYPVDDQQIKIVDIPPGYTHSIENSGTDSMIVLFWANEIFDPQNADTYSNTVLE